MTPLSEKANAELKELKTGSLSSDIAIEFIYKCAYHTAHEELQAELTRLKKEVEELREIVVAVEKMCNNEVPEMEDVWRLTYGFLNKQTAPDD